MGRASQFLSGIQHKQFTTGNANTLTRKYVQKKSTNVGAKLKKQKHIMFVNSYNSCNKSYHHKRYQTEKSMHETKKQMQPFCCIKKLMQNALKQKGKNVQQKNFHNKKKICETTDKTKKKLKNFVYKQMLVSNEYVELYFVFIDNI